MTWVGPFDQVFPFIVRRRVPLSVLIFGSVVGFHIWSGKHSLSPADWHNPWSLLAVCLIALGVAIRSWAAGTLRKGVVLATTGPYRMVRNPLYLGSFLMMAGFSLLLANPLSALVIAGPVLFIYSLTVRREERDLSGRFGTAWTQFATSTPRFLPRRLQWDISDWSFAQWRQSREYQALVGSLLAIAAIWLWQLH